MKAPLPPGRTNTAQPGPKSSDALTDEGRERAIQNDDFAGLMQAYSNTNAEVTRLKDLKKDADATLGALKDSMREVATNIGLAKGSTFRVEGAGKFNWTTQRGFNLPAGDREQFVRLLIERGEISLLTIGSSNLNAWCNQVIDDYDEDDPDSFRLPSYIQKFEDTMVPRVALDKKKE